MKNTKIGLLIVIIIYTVNLKGQEYLPKIIPSSPQSQIFEKYVDYPVTEYSGLAQINIPLYEIKTKGITIPITLSYYAGGIKYNPESSYVGNSAITNFYVDGDVGAGWSINATGSRVSRKINGKPDDKYSMFKKADFDTNRGQSVAKGDQYLAGIQHYRNQAPLFLNVSSGSYLDSEYDMFTYMLLDNNGHFILDQNKKPQIIERNPHLISIDNTYSEIIINDDNGNKYYFGGSKTDGTKLVETVEINQLSAEKANSAWPLAKLITAYGETITYQYNTFNSTWSYPRISSGIKLNEAYTFAGHKFCTPSNSALIQPSRIMSSTSYDELMVSQISTDNETITITRGGIANLPKNIISDIDIKDKKGVLIRKIKFDYFVPTSTSWHCQLKEIKVMDATLVEKKYTFTYYAPPATTSLTATSDQWGYYTNWGVSASNVNTKVFLHNEFNTLSIISKVDANPSGVYNVTSQRIIDCLPTFTQNTINRTYNSNPSYFSLKTITYPTGGITEYIYEPHQYKFGVNDAVSTGGGQRIKKIISTADTKSPKITIEYQYGENENGIGKSNLNLTSRNFIDTYINASTIGAPCQGATQSYRFDPVKIFSTNPHFAEFSDFKVYYSQVVKYQYEDVKSNMGMSQKSNGKILTTYKIPVEYSEGNMQGATPSNSLLSQYYKDLNLTRINDSRIGYKPVLLTKQIFDRNNLKIQEEIYSYLETLNNLSFEGLMVDQKVIFTGGFAQLTNPAEQYNVYAHVNGLFNWMTYKINTGTNLLQSKQVTQYSDQGSLKITESYTYDDLKRIKTITQVNSANENYMKEFVYPVSGTALYNANIVSAKIEEITKKNGLEIERQKSIYNNSILPSSLQSSVSGSANLRTNVTFDKYDSRGNLQQFTAMDGSTTTYLWSYNKQYPVAEIKNATLAEVEAQLGMTAEALSTTNPPDLTKVEALRSKLPKANVTVYNYKPLVGLTTITNPAGLKITYEYDRFNRLETLKDHNGKKTSSFTYGYNNGQAISDGMDPALNNELYSLIEPDIPSFKLTYPLNKSLAPFTIYVEGGSGNFKYSWYLKNSSASVVQQAVDTSSPYFYCNKLLQTGPMELSCIIKDLTTGKTKTLIKNFSAIIEPIVSVDFGISPPYYASIEYSFTSTVEGGSGQFTYSWYLYNNSNNQLVTSSLDNATSVYKRSFTAGTYQLVCMVKDKLSQETKSISKVFTVTSSSQVGFTNIVNQTNNTKASVSVTTSTIVTFEVQAWSNYASTFEGTSITFIIGGQSIYMSAPEKKTITVSMSPNGSNNVSIVYTKGSGSRVVNSSIRITNAGSTNTVGPTSTLGFSY